MREIAVLLIVFGLLMALVGALLFFAGEMPFLGKLPGDIVLRGRNWRVYFPITTCILLSIVLTLILALLTRFLGK